MKKLVYLFLSLLAVFSSSHSAENETLKFESQEEFCKFMPFKMALPENYVGIQFEGSDWRHLGEESTLRDLLSQYETPYMPINPKTCFIRLKISQNSGQKEIFEDNNDDELLHAFKNRDLKIRRSYFGSYPVKAVESGIEEGKPFLMGWIGLNCGGPVILFNFIVPENRPSYEKEMEIWSRFLNETAGRPKKEMDAIYNAHPEC